MSDIARSAGVDDWVDAPVTGITLIIVGMSLFSIQDVAIRLMSGNLSVIQIMFLRGILAIGPMAAIAVLRGGVVSLQPRRPFLLAARSCLMVTSYLLYYLAMATMPIADVTAIFFVAPLITTMMSIPFLGETVGTRRWVAVGVGFLGVLVIVQPGNGSLDPAAFLVLGASVAYAGSIMITRKVGRSQSGASLAFHGMVGFIIISGVGGLFLGDGTSALADFPSLKFLLRGWSAPSGGDWMLIALCAAIATCGFYCLSQAYRVAPASVAAPFEYLAMPLAVIWGFAVWNEVPAATTFIGIAMIIGSGLYVLHREQMRSQKINSGRGVRLRL